MPFLLTDYADAFCIMKNIYLKVFGIDVKLVAYLILILNKNLSPF